MKRGIKLLELQDENMEKMIVIISEIKNSRDWSEILAVILEKKEIELKVLIEVNGSFITDEELEVKNYFDSFIKVTDLEEASEVVDGIKGILDSKGLVNLNIGDLVSLGFKNGKEVFFRKIEGQSLEKIKSDLGKLKNTEGVESLIFHLENIGIEFNELTVAREIYECILIP